MNGLARETITIEVLGEALRHLRTSKDLTIREVVQRAATYGRQGLGGLGESQISGIERGHRMPTMNSLFSFLAACCGSVNLCALQRAIELSCLLKGNELGLEAPGEALKLNGHSIQLSEQSGLEPELNERLRNIEEAIAEIRACLFHRQPT